LKYPQRSIDLLQFFLSGSSRHADAATPAANRRLPVDPGHGVKTQERLALRVARKERDPADREQAAALWKNKACKR